MLVLRGDGIVALLEQEREVVVVAPREAALDEVAARERACGGDRRVAVDLEQAGARAVELDPDRALRRPDNGGRVVLDRLDDVAHRGRGRVGVPADRDDGRAGNDHHREPVVIAGRQVAAGPLRGRGVGGRGIRGGEDRGPEAPDRRDADLPALGEIAGPSDPGHGRRVAVHAQRDADDQGRRSGGGRVDRLADRRPDHGGGIAGDRVPGCAADLEDVPGHVVR